MPYDCCYKRSHCIIKCIQQLLKNMTCVFNALQYSRIILNIKSITDVDLRENLPYVVCFMFDWPVWSKEWQVMFWGAPYQYTRHWHFCFPDMALKIPQCDFEFGQMRKTEGVYMPQWTAQFKSELGHFKGFLMIMVSVLKSGLKDMSLFFLRFVLVFCLCGFWFGQFSMIGLCNIKCQFTYAWSSWN